MMSGYNFLLSRDFHVTKIMGNLDVWLSNAFLNQVFYLFTCCFIASKSDITAGLIEKGQTVHCIVCIFSKIHGQNQQRFKASASWKVFPIQADLTNWKVAQWDQYIRLWSTGAINGLRKLAVYKGSSWVY